MAAEAPTSAGRRMKPGLVAAVDRFVARVDGAEAAQTAAGVRVRKGIAVLVGCYALVYVAQGALHGSLVSPVGLIMLMIAFALYDLLVAEGEDKVAEVLSQMYEQRDTLGILATDEIAEWSRAQ